MDNDLIRSFLFDKSTLIQRYLMSIGATYMDAEEIVQDTIYKGFLYIDSIEPQKFSSWLFKVATNHYYDLCRKQKRHLGISLDPEQLFDVNTPESVLLLKERDQKVKDTLSKLPQIQQQLLLMKYHSGLSYKEIGELLDIKQGHVKTYLYRARRKFQELYGGTINE